VKILLVVILMLGIVVSPVLAHTGGLQNPNFEAGFFRYSPSSFRPTGWYVEQLPGQHEMESRPTNPIYGYRVHDGVYSFQMFNTYAPMNVLVYQSLYTPGGLRNFDVDFSIWFHGWWWSEGDPEFVDDERWGRRPISNGNVSRAWVFISTEEPDIYSCTLGSGQAIQDEYKELSISANLAPNTKFWVGICMNSPAAQTNDFYLDNASLVMSSRNSPINPPTPQHTPTPEITPTALPSGNYPHPPAQPTRIIGTPEILVTAHPDAQTTPHSQPCCNDDLELVPVVVDVTLVYTPADYEVTSEYYAFPGEVSPFQFSWMPLALVLVICFILVLILHAFLRDLQNKRIK